MRRTTGFLVVVALVVAAVATGPTAGSPSGDSAGVLLTGFRDGCCATSSTSVGLATSSTSVAGELPLAGRVIVIDPGHQLGNHNFPQRVNRPVPAGGFRKPCNTTGTATNRGYPEATFVWRVSMLLRDRLVDRGARVVLTRHSNRQDRWGPCVDERGRAGNAIGADLKISVHGDGSYAAGARGFHVIAPTDRRPWTHDIYAASKRFARDTRAALRGVGLPVANYIAGGDGLDFRSDLATLNLSDVPTVMVELGNMRSSRDARRMTSSAGRSTYARGLLRAVSGFLGA